MFVKKYISQISLHGHRTFQYNMSLSPMERQKPKSKVNIQSNLKILS